MLQDQRPAGDGKNEIIFLVNKVPEKGSHLLH